MCDPSVIPIAIALAGSAIAYKGSSDAQSAAASAQNQAMQTQNTAFNARMQTQREQLAEQTGINRASEQRFTENQAETQRAQTQALADRTRAITAMNDQQAVTASRADNVVKQGTDAATAQALAAAQTQQVQTQQAITAPSVAQVTATNPLGAVSSGVTKDAVDARLRGAADYAKTYGDTQAALTSYNAPIALAGRTATGIGTNLMPQAVADQLVRSGAPALLGPSTTAYQQSGAYGAALNSANQHITSGGLALAGARAGAGIDLANLSQADANALIQSRLIQAQTAAAQTAAIGQGISTLGNAGIGIAASNGAYSGLGQLFSGGSTPTAAALNAAPPGAGGIISNAPVAFKIT